MQARHSPALAMFPCRQFALNTLAFRVGKKLEWDAAAMRAKNAPEAQPFIQRAYRKGWSL